MPKNWHIKNKNNSFIIIREKIEKVKEFSASHKQTYFDVCHADGSRSKAPSQGSFCYSLLPLHTLP